MPTTIPAAQQFKAVALLRWHLFVNAFRRKGNVGELIARILAILVGCSILFGITSGAAAIAFFSVSNGHPGSLALLFWGIFLLQILVSINLSTPGLSFDPQSLIRFPLSLPRYLLIRLFLGLLSASNVVGLVAMLAAATGAALATRTDDFAASVAKSGQPFATQPFILTLYAGAILLALANMLFNRMLFAWVDRWLSTRRAREVMTGLIIASSLAFQYINVTINGFGRHTNHAEQKARLEAFKHAYHLVSPFLASLPPGLAGGAAIRAAAGQSLFAILSLLGVLLFAALFLGVFAWRMQREYRGENLSEVNHAKDLTPATSTARLPAPHPVGLPVAAQVGPYKPPIAALMLKEWTYIKRNPSQFYGLLLPLAMVLILRAPLAAFTRGGLAFPSAAAYCLLGIAALGYNVLGLDGSGVQFYFLSPVPFRTIFLAKNLFSFALTLLQITLLFAALCYMSGPPPLIITLSTLCWVAFASLVNVTVGNMRSITTPKKIDPSKISRKQASQLSALLALGIMMVMGALGAALLVASRLLNLPWLPIPVFLCLIAGAIALYLASLGRLDKMALNHRETLIEELSKAT